MATQTDRVFSPLVRIGHWGGALAFLVVYVTAGRPLPLHTRIGYALTAYVLWRLVWGVVGPSRARFADLLSSPRAYFDDLKGLLQARPIRHAGLGPIGSLIAVSMLVAVVLAAVSGITTAALRHGEGPLAAFLGSVPEPEPAATTQYGTDGGTTIIPRTDRASIDNSSEHPDVKPGRWAKRLHGTLSLLALWLVILHVVHVLYASLVRGENLLYDMITGNRAPRAEPPAAAARRPAAPVAPGAAERQAVAQVAAQGAAKDVVPLDLPPQGAFVPLAAPAWSEPHPDAADGDEDKTQKKLMKKAARKERRREGSA